MDTTIRDGRHLALIVTAVIVALAWPATAVSGQVAQNKTFTIDVTDAVPAGDADAGLTVTVANTSQNQSLGSANVAVPAPFAVVDAPRDTDPSTTSVLELRDLELAPGEATEVAMTVHVQRCTPATSSAFAAAAKQSNTFNGTGNDFFLDADASDLTVQVTGACGLAFVAQAGDAEDAPTVITSVDFDPAGGPITVEVLDATGTGRATHATPTVELSAANPDVDPGQEGPIVLGGTTSAGAVDGLATFEPGPTLSPSAFDYTMTATTDLDRDGAPDVTTTGEPFDIVDDQVDCPAGEPCAAPASATDNGRGVTASFGAGDEPASLVVSLGAADVPAFTCTDVPTDRATAQYFFVGGDAGDRTGTLTLTLPDAARPLNAYEVCWAAPYEFATDDGGRSSGHGTKPDGGAALQVGTLPDCARRGAPARPCVSDRSYAKRTATVTIVIQADGRDPWARS